MIDEMPTTLEAALARITQLRADIEDLQDQIEDYEDECYIPEPDPEPIEALARALELLKRGAFEAAAYDIRHALLKLDCDGRVQGSVVVAR